MRSPIIGGYLALAVTAALGCGQGLISRSTNLPAAVERAAQNWSIFTASDSDVLASDEPGTGRDDLAGVVGNWAFVRADGSPQFMEFVAFGTDGTFQLPWLIRNPPVAGWSVPAGKTGERSAGELAFVSVVAE